jgi:glycosyltransferase involved in cell wall biosynthesis
MEQVRSQQSEVSQETDRTIGYAIQHGDVAAAVAALKAAADQTQEERAAMGLRARQVATEKFGHEQLVEQFLKTVLKTARDC